jgi:ankyrin repeat protein
MELSYAEVSVSFWKKIFSMKESREVGAGERKPIGASAISNPKSRVAPSFASGTNDKFFAAVLESDVSAVRDLIAAANVNARVPGGDGSLVIHRPFDFWILNDDNASAVVSLLLQAGADINARDGDGRTPLMRAAGRNCLNCVRLLIEKGADARLKSKSGMTAFQYVLAKNDWDYNEVKKLLAHSSEDGP